jgi:hypothetical protein
MWQYVRTVKHLCSKLHLSSRDNIAFNLLVCRVKECQEDMTVVRHRPTDTGNFY